jgi:hypothetical protein
MSDSMGRPLLQHQSRLLGLLTITAAQRLRAETFLIEQDGDVRQVRMARVGDLVLVDHPADATGPRSINCYQIAGHSTDGAAFKLDPSRLVYSLQWQHNAHPPDFHLALVQELPEQWINAANLVLLGAPRRWAPQAINWTEMRDVVPVLDAFERI